MDFLKKAKASLKDLEGDLTKATHALGLGKDDEAAPNSTSFDTPASTTMNTPTTTVPPSVVSERPHTKLPLAVRKNVRDGYENKHHELEGKLSEVMGIPWKVDVDPSYLYTFANEDRSYAKENLGPMITNYIETATNSIRDWIKKAGPEGRAELNRLAASHSLTIENTTNPSIRICGCDIANGQLRILFAKDRLAYNMNQIFDGLQEAINAAGVSTSAGGASVLDFNAKRSIRDGYDSKVEAVSARLQKILALPMLTLIPNFEANFAAISAYERKAKEDGELSNMFPREWPRHLGGTTLTYFDEFASHLEYAGFAKDDMLQDGFKDVVDKNEIALKVVPKLQKGRYNECLIENGVLVLQTTPPMWRANIREAGEKVIDLL